MKRWNLEISTILLFINHRLIIIHEEILVDRERVTRGFLRIFAKNDKKRNESSMSRL